MKVYVVTQGEYSDYSIRAIFDNKEQADLYCESVEGAEYSWDKPDIEEWEMNEVRLNKGDRCWYIRMAKDGTVLQANIDNSLYDHNGTGVYAGGNMFTRCFAPDKDTAIKIANDRRAVLIAENKL